MTRIRTALIAAAFALLAPAGALAQSTCPNIVQGAILTPGQWNACFQVKQDLINYTPVNKAGDFMTGELVTAAPTSSQSGFKLPPGTAPASPANGDLWVTSSGLYVRVNGVTIGPISGATASSYAATAPVTVAFPAGVVTYGFNYGTAGTFTSAQAINLNAASLPAPISGTGFTVGAADAAVGRIQIDSFGAISAFTGAVYGGTAASPTAVTSGTQLTGVNAYAYNGAALVGPVVSFRTYAAENIASGHQGSKACVATTANSSTTLTDNFCVNNDGSAILVGSLLQIAGTTASFPAIKRDATGIDIRLADDSGFAPLQSSTLTTTGLISGGGAISAVTRITAQNATAIPAGGTQDAGYLFSSTAHFGAFFGSGAPTLSAAQGSLYLRSDGAPYYNTNGTTGWMQLATFGANTFTGDQAVVGASFGLLGAISAPAWTTSGVRYKNVAATLTDTSSSGTVATAYTDVWGGNTIAASSATTFTNYYGSYFKVPANGTNVSFTHVYAIGADSANFTTLAINGTAVGLPVSAANGGTGIANSSTITVGGAVSTAGAFTTSGAFGLTLTATNTTNATLPAGTHTLAGLDVVNAFSGNNSFSGTTTYTGSLIVPTRTVTAAGTITVSATTDYFICVNKTVGAATPVNLPSSPATGLTYTVKDCKGDAATNNITLTPAAGNIDGSGTYAITANFGSVSVTYNGAAWSLN